MPAWFAEEVTLHALRLPDRTDSIEEADAVASHHPERSGEFLGDASLSDDVGQDATSKSAVQGSHETPKIGQLKPLTRFTISLNFIATAFRIGDDAAWLPSPADRSPAQTEERGVRRFFSDASGNVANVLSHRHWTRRSRI